jgi:hypothetical protein
MLRTSTLATLLAVWILGGSVCRAADDAVPLGSGACDHTARRAGYPEEISRFARPANTCAYDGYYVGGGCPCRGAGPGPLEGTWGWDYIGRCPRLRRVMLGWCCRYQGGSGAYKTDGPPVPNVFSIKLPERCPEAEGH